MKNAILFSILFLFSVTGLSQTATDGAQHMLNAITLCSSPNNPLTDGIQKLGGNVWGAVDAVEDPSTGMTTLTTTVWHSLHALNLAIMTVDRIVGKITLKMGYPSTTRVDRPLVCELTVDYL